MTGAKVLAFQSRREFPHPDAEESFRSICELSARFQVEVVPYRLRDAAGLNLIDGAASYVLNNGFSHLFVAADDLIYPGFIIPKLVNRKVDIVGGLYPKRRTENGQVIPATWEDCSMAEFNERRRNKAFISKPFISAHTMMISRTVFEKMSRDFSNLKYKVHGSEETYLALWIPMVYEGRYYHDDWSFCIRARQSGFQIWQDYGIECKHQVPATFAEFEPLNMEA